MPIGMTLGEVLVQTVEPTLSPTLFVEEDDDENNLAIIIFVCAIFALGGCFCLFGFFLEGTRRT